MESAPQTSTSGSTEGKPTTLSRDVIALTKAAQEITAELSLERLLQRIVDHARGIVGCSYAALGLFDEKRHIQQFITSGIDKVTRERMGPPPQGKGLLKLVLDAEEPLCIDDISSHPDSVGFPPGHPVMKTFLGTPICYKGRPLGNLYLAEKEAGVPFTEADAQIVAMFAAQAGVALENARLLAEAERRADEARQEQRSVETVLNSMAEGIYTIDASWRITRINVYAADQASKEPLALVGVPCHSVFKYATKTGQSICRTACPALKAMETGEVSYIMEATLQLADGKTIPVAMLTSPIRDPDGKVVGAVEISRDISQRKAIYELQDSIISHVSHELRTPLFHIKGFASSLLQPDVEWDEETRTDFIRTIDQEADRLTRLVSDLLDMSRLESGRMVMTLEPIDLPSVVHEAIEHTAPFLKERMVKNRFPARLPMALGDRSKVEQVLENLLENASKYSPPRTPITVTARSEDGMIRVAVRDNGLGVPAHERERIFEKFVRLEHDREFRFPGTGLGLSICKAIVVAHGGQIRVEAAPGKGSIFSFTLPPADGPEADGMRKAVKLW